jgi:hypothetical protein
MHAAKTMTITKPSPQQQPIEKRIPIGCRYMSATCYLLQRRPSMKEVSCLPLPLRCWMLPRSLDTLAMHKYAAAFGANRAAVGL